MDVQGLGPGQQFVPVEEPQEKGADADICILNGVGPLSLDQGRQPEEGGPQQSHTQPGRHSCQPSRRSRVLALVVAMAQPEHHSVAGGYRCQYHGVEEVGQDHRPEEDGSQQYVEPVTVAIDAANGPESPGEEADGQILGVVAAVEQDFAQGEWGKQVDRRCDQPCFAAQVVANEKVSTQGVAQHCQEDHTHEAGFQRESRQLQTQRDEVRQRWGKIPEWQPIPIGQVGRPSGIGDPSSPRVGEFQRPVEMDRGVSGARQAGLQQG